MSPSPTPLSPKQNIADSIHTPSRQSKKAAIEMAEGQQGNPPPWQPQQNIQQPVAAPNIDTHHANTQSNDIAPFDSLPTSAHWITSQSHTSQPNATDMVRTTYHLGSWKGLTIEDWHCRWVSVPIQPYQQAFHEGIPLNPATLGRQEVGPIHNGGQGSWYYLLIEQTLLAPAGIRENEVFEHASNGEPFSTRPLRTRGAAELGCCSTTRHRHGLLAVCDQDLIGPHLVCSLISGSAANATNCTSPPRASTKRSSESRNTGKRP
ncbi:MAG: hypothetical protein LQ346_005776 [Caloplaca aetnensis]|nr:MAG: hypothetical protein LQ346_005776 [Caloplaca aetnensis]